MERGKLRLVLLLPLIAAISCGTPGPAPTTENNTDAFPPAEIGTVPDNAVAPPAENAAFDPRSVSQELFNATKTDVQHFIEKLNEVIRNKNYTAWKTELSPSFFAEISSSEFLQQITGTDAMKTRNIVLKTPEDYFNNVVVPSRANSRVDDIDFVSQNRVKAYTIITNREGQAQRLRLYDLEFTGNIWKIIN